MILYKKLFGERKMNYCTYEDYPILDYSKDV